MKNWRIGIDVGGTNTDAVVLDDKLNLIASVKCPTTQDVMSGIEHALHQVLGKERVEKQKIGYAMLGTTQCTNAIVERKKLKKVAVIRLGKPATEAVKPLADWPEDLKKSMDVSWYLVEGGHEFDGREINPLNEKQLKEIALEIKEKAEAVALISVFSSVTDVHEKRAEKILKSILGENFPISISSEIGSLGLVERENATILNAALTDVARNTAKSFVEALKRENIDDVEIYLGQNDGTLMSVEYAVKYPILTIACGPTNSIRGAAFLTGKRDAIVVDVGGTTTDVGVLVNGFPRESMIAVEIGKVRTNFRMPDLVSIGLGGGSLVKSYPNGEVEVGPESVGYQVTEEALCFGGDTLTATDIIVAKGLVDSVGDPQLVASLDPILVEKAYEKIVGMTEECIDMMKTSRDDVEVILVGGGSILIPTRLKGCSQVHKPNNFGVANAIGSAIAQVSGQIEKIFALEEISREEALLSAKKLAKEEAKKAGADPDSIQIIDAEDIPLAYLPGNATKIRIKAVGDLVMRK